MCYVDRYLMLEGKCTGDGSVGDGPAPRSVLGIVSGLNLVLRCGNLVLGRGLGSVCGGGGGHLQLAHLSCEPVDAVRWHRRLLQ